MKAFTSQLQKTPPVQLYLVKRPEPATRYQINDAYKRAFDVIGATFLLLFFMPLMLLVTLLIKLTMPGPIFFKQERVTQNERKFDILKFRTMVVDAEAKTGPTWVRKNDNRVTPLGRILRATHMDEVPQLLNVLAGDMSLVGPRPERPIFVEQFKSQGIARYADRHLAKTGIAGYAQLRCPHPTMKDIEDKTEADLWYIENWTPWLDLKIIGGTYFYVQDSIVNGLKRHFSKPAPTVLAEATNLAIIKPFEA